MRYSTFSEFLKTARPPRQPSGVNFSRDGLSATIANRDMPGLSGEGVIRAVFTGFHLYAKLDLRPRLTTSSNNEEREKNIRILARLTQGVRDIVHVGFEGALLEAHGPMVHAFIPDQDITSHSAKEASVAIQAFIQTSIKKDAGDDLLKGLVSYCHGPSIFVASVDLQGDNSIVSLAPAANIPAKVLWTKSEDLPNGSIVETSTDGRYRLVNPETLPDSILNRKRITALNARTSELPLVEMIQGRSVGVPAPDAPDSPTVENPQKSYSISVRADQDGFTGRVEAAFREGSHAVEALAEDLHRIMVHAREFCRGDSVIHLPWVGDCFNILIADDERDVYQENRKRRILEILTAFEAHMADEFPDIKWAFSCAGGDLEPNQACNTLVSRMTLGETSILLATGLPVERTLLGLASDSPDAGKGILWKEDPASLDEDLQAIIEPCPGGKNYRHFSVADVRKREQKAKLASSLLAPPTVYVPTPAQAAKTATQAPKSRPYYSGD